MARKKAKGLGDTIEQITEATGIKALVKFVAGDDCGCEARKEKLNQLFPYHKPNCLSEHDYNFLTEFFNRPDKNTVRPSDQYRLMSIYKAVFNKPIEFTTCSSCMANTVKQIKTVYDTYVQENISSQQDTEVK